MFPREKWKVYAWGYKTEQNKTQLYNTELKKEQKCKHSPPRPKIQIY